jgi:hypothetical protein
MGFSWRVGISAALGFYFLWGALLIAQKPGLQEDEALLVVGATHLELGSSDPTIPKPDGWISIPLMSATYVGSLKDYLSFPLFAIFGPRAPVVRLVSLVLGAVGIWGVAKMIAQPVGPAAGIAVALVLSVSPSYLTMVVFDNNAVGAMMSSLGLLCVAVGRYVRDRTGEAAFWVGISVGFAVWARANFAWTLIAIGIAVLLVYRGRVLAHVSHLGYLVIGGIGGGAPFLIYQLVSNGATWRVQDALATQMPVRQLIPYRAAMFAETFLSEGEHRKMWGDVSLPVWQLWLFPILVLVAGLICVTAKQARSPYPVSLGRAAVASFLLLGAILFATRLTVAEHHFVAMLPVAVVIIVLASVTLKARFPAARLGIAGLALLYGSCAVYWDVVSIRGLKRTGGIGDWSDAIVTLARYCDEHRSGDRLDVLDWGFSHSLYVLTNGRQTSTELFWGATATTSGDQRSWSDVIKDGGVFLVPGPRHRHFSAAINGFLEALAESQPVAEWHTVFERDGAPYAQIIDIKPHSGHTPAPGEPVLLSQFAMDDPRVAPQLRGFYPPEPNGWRWTNRQFSITTSGVNLRNGAWLSMDFYVPKDYITKTTRLTLTAEVSGHALPPEVYSQPGEHVLERAVPGDWIGSDNTLKIDFALSQTLHLPADKRELGVVVHQISIEPR